MREVEKMHRHVAFGKTWLENGFGRKSKLFIVEYDVMQVLFICAREMIRTNDS